MNPNLVSVKRTLESNHTSLMEHWFQAATKNKHENSCTFRNFKKIAFSEIFAIFQKCVGGCFAIFRTCQ